MSGVEQFAETLTTGNLETEWIVLPAGKTTLKCMGVFSVGTVTFKVGKMNLQTLAVREASLLTDGIFDATTAGVRNINYGTGEANGQVDVIKATLSGGDGSSSVDIYVSPYEGAT